MNDEKIEKLWNWFLHNEQQIIDCIEQESATEKEFIIEQLNNLILDMGRFSWEVSPGLHKLWSFTISPNGDKDLLIKSKKIISTAPDHKKWEFHYCRPARDWDRNFTLYDSFMDEQEINASNWKYVAINNQNGKIILKLEANNIKHLDYETALTAANLVVVNEIGEEYKINSISEVDIVHQLGSEYDSQKTDISSLKKQINEITIG